MNPRSWLRRKWRSLAGNSGDSTGSLAGLSDDLRQRVEALAQARGESVSDVLTRYKPEVLRRCPKRFSPMIAYLRKAGFEASGIGDGLAYVVLPKGKTIYGYISKPSHVRQYKFVKDLVSPALTAETFFLGLNIATRYLRENFDEPFAFQIKPGDTVVEVGAYVGHLSMWFAESVGAGGRVIAVEMMAQNVQILKKNVLENSMQDIVKVVQGGAWHSRGELVVKSKGMQRSSLASIESLENGEEFKISVNTLDNMLDDLDVSNIDVAFVTANGAEINVLKGFRRYLPKTRAIAIAAPYTTEGKSNAEECASFLSELNFAILPTPNPKLVLAARSQIEET